MLSDLKLRLELLSSKHFSLQHRRKAHVSEVYPYPTPLWLLDFSFLRECCSGLQIYLTLPYLDQ
ncbi:hypothetical protein OUZ56_007283 [Daphnia magna]|uniref:Uncharacterized protein n=1 Tax=Daphnia magna TaxID=35525 RepID=A0ABQ9YYM3_9CRUS|nr:hypothetical protein OUZ56_007283 [Daphnia magna]